MNDVSKLSGASPVSPTSGRVWKPPRKHKPGDRPAGKKPERPRKEDRGSSGGRENKDPVEIEEIELPEDDGESLGYGSGVLKRPRTHKVNLII